MPFVNTVGSTSTIDLIQNALTTLTTVSSPPQLGAVTNPFAADITLSSTITLNGTTATLTAKKFTTMLVPNGVLSGPNLLTWLAQEISSRVIPILDLAFGQVQRTYVVSVGGYANRDGVPVVFSWS